MALSSHILHLSIFITLVLTTVSARNLAMRGGQFICNKYNVSQGVISAECCSAAIATFRALVSTVNGRNYNAQSLTAV